MATMSSASAYRPSSSRPSTRSHHASRSSATHIPFTAGTSTGVGIGAGSGGTGAGSSYRHEEDAVIIELGARYLRAGFEGESSPMCVLRFSPEDGRRVGDYRGWIQPKYGKNKKKIEVYDLDEWCGDYPFWKADMRDHDLRLFEDRLERTIRGVYNKYLLTDAGNSRMVLVIPSIVSHPVLSSVLSTIFNRWKHPSITLLPSATMSAVAAGLRSALVVDIGWEETTVTAVYEYREIKARRSTRATKLLMHRIAMFLSRLERIEEIGLAAVLAEEARRPEGAPVKLTVDFDSCEELMNRLSWCRRKVPWGYGSQAVTQQASASGADDGHPFQPDPFPVNIPLPSGKVTCVPFRDIADMVEEMIFVNGVDPRDFDDEELPLDYIVYATLLDMSPDVRGMLMARIVFTGGGSEIVGIKQRTMDGVERLVGRYGWSAVRGTVLDRMKAEGSSKRRGTARKLAVQQQQKQQHPPGEQASSTQPNDAKPQTTNLEGEKKHEEAEMPITDDNPTTTPPLRPRTSSVYSPTPVSPFQPPSIPAHAQSIPPNPIDTKLARQHAQSNPPPAPVIGTLRHLTTLGPWAGASLTVSLNIKGVVEIERERFLKDGISGWSGTMRRETGEHGGHKGHDDTKEKRRSVLVGKKDRDSVGGRDRGSWTLGGWA